DAAVAGRDRTDPGSIPERTFREGTDITTRCHFDLFRLADNRQSLAATVAVSVDGVSRLDRLFRPCPRTESAALDMVFVTARDHAGSTCVHRIRSRSTVDG